MAGIFGQLGLADTDYVFNRTVGQNAIYEVATEWINDRNTELQGIIGLFVDMPTEDYKFRYHLPGGGFLQRRARTGRPGAVKQSGYWDVALPLEDFAAGIETDDVSMGYMTVRRLELHMQTVVSQNVNSIRHEILSALLRNANWSFVDENFGTLTVVPLANGDSVVYPPVLGATAEATDNHYLNSGYTVANMSDTNNPFVTIADELQEHFGASTGNDNIMAFFNTDITPEARALADFVATTDMGISPGDDTATVLGIPGHPGRLIGRLEDSGVWLVEWRFIPSTYIFGMDLDAPVPLGQRVDPADTGLGQGLQLVSQDDEFPFNESFWRNRVGYGVTNRLNGVSMLVDASGSYSIPTGYSK